MATSQDQDGEQVVPDDGAENDVRAVQAWYLRSPSPSSISMVSDAYTESIFMEPIHLSSAIAAKQIINQELKHKEVKVDTMCPMMMESAEQLLVEDLYNRVKEKIDDRSLFNTPCVLDLQRELVMDRLEAPINSVDEVWPNVFIAEKTVAVNKGRLKRMGITHILNTGHNTTVFTGPDFYTGMEIHYMGVEVDDFPDSDISKFFRPAAEFLDEALLTYRGKILVNSEMGISRSAILVAAYLMIFHHMTILEALMTIRKKRAIYPNDGFIMQLRALNETLLEEREMSDLEDGDDDKSQGSVVEAKAHSIMVEEEDVESIMGAKVHSITVEEEDTTSMMGSIMSQTGKMSVVSKQPTLIDEDEEEKIYEEWRRKQGLPPRDIPKKEPASDMKFPEQGEVSDNNVDQRIHEWQCQNAKYQSLGLEDNESSLMGGGRYSPSELSDVSSVTSQDIRALKKHLEASGINRMNRGRSDSVSTDSTWDMWNERLQEIEKEATVKSQNKDRADHGREKDIDEESVFSEANSLYNFCKKNKHKLTPLERWKIKRIQFGFHKKDSQSSETQNKEENGGQKEGEEPSQSDVDITAYQAWKMKHQKKIGNENKDEIVEIAKGEDTATTKRKQRRAEILERSKQTLEESQSMCGWDTESSISGSIPLSAFFPNVPSASGANDAASVLSIQSNKSRVSQSKSVSAQSQIATVPIMPAGPGDGISMASIQNWIANVVSETIAQKQNEIIMMSRASSALSTASGDVGKNVDDDKSSLFGAAGGSCLSSSVLQHRGSNSVISYNTSMSGNTELSSAKKKITQTSVPLYGLFVDDVDLKKLNQKEHEMREELSEKMSQYQKEKIATINKRSSLYKKKKAKDDEDDKQAESLSNLREQKISNRNWKKSETNSFSSYSALANATSSQLENNISKWLNGVETNGKPASQSENISERYSTRPQHQKNLDAEFNGHGFTRKVTEQDNLSESSYQSNRATSRFSASSEEEDSYSTRRSKVHEYTNFREVRPMQYVNESSAEASRIEKPELECSRPGQRHPSEDHGNADNSDTSDIGSKRKFNQSFEKFDEEEAKEENGVTENKYSTGRWSQYRKSKEEEEEDKDDDEIIAAWRRRQEEKKSRLRKNAEDD